jgi:(p)ppGpp synthase/HD superfamily hydrolase
MIYTSSIEKAIKIATKYHQFQFRKGDSTLPYVSHCFSVACIVSNYTQSENIIIAALLHDIIEDTEYTYQQLETDFGTEIKEIVEGDTERIKKDHKNNNWIERKTDYLKQLTSQSEASLLIAAADKIHYMLCNIEEFEITGKLNLKKYNSTAKQQLWYYKEILELLKIKLHSEIVKLYAETFQKFSQILNNYT